MAAVDSLNIKVEASARGANQQLDKLVQKMMELRRTLGGIQTNELNAFAKSLHNFSDAAKAMSGVKTSDFTRMAKGLDQLANVQKMEKAAQSAEKTADALQKAVSTSKKALDSGLKFDSSGIQDMQKSIHSLSKEYEAVGQGKNFVGNLTETPVIPVNTAEVTNSSIADVQANVQKIYQAIPEAARYSVEESQKSLNEAIAKAHEAENSLHGFDKKIAEARENLSNIEKSGGYMGTDKWNEAYVALQKAEAEAKAYKAALNREALGIDTDIKSTDRLDEKLQKLRADLKQLKIDGFGFGDKPFDDTYRKILKTDSALKKYKEDLKESVGGEQNLSTFDRVKQGFHSIWIESQQAGNSASSFGGKLRSLMTSFRGNAVSAFGSRLKALIPIFRGTTSSTGNLISKLAKLYVGFRSLRGIGEYLRGAVESSMDYIEEFNYFDTTLGKIASEWGKDYKKYGYQNAKEYGESFKSRLTDTMGMMTGFQIENDGTLSDIGKKSLGLDPTQMTNYAAGVAQVTNSVGMTGEASTVTSKALSMLAGDMSSFRNLDMDTVMNNFSSGLIGQSRALYKYGIDITNATLQQYAYDNGIKKSLSDMTQNEKMQLRMLAILDQSKVAWGDLAKTINSPSNQLRLLQNNFKSLSRTIGNMFLPAVAKVLPYVNGLVIAVRKLFEWTASMLGIKLKDVIGESGGGYSDAFDGLEEDADNADSAVSGIGDSADKSSDSVKKLAKQLMGFDELNVITTSESNGKNNNGNGSGGAPIDLTSQLSDALGDYEKVWNKAYNDMTSDAEKFAGKLTKLFKDAWNSGDGTEIGEAIAGWLNKGIDWVNKNVGKFSDGLNKIAGILGTALNGFIGEYNWAGLGQAVGNSIKACLEAEEHFFDTVNWVNLGKGLATSLNNAIKTGVIQQYFKTMASELKAGIETAFGFVTTFDFQGLGDAVGQGINDFFDKMGQVNKDTGLNGWQELGKTISDGIKGITTSISTALITVKWDQVGQAIATAIGSIDFAGIAWDFGDLALKILGAIAEAIQGAFAQSPVETAIITALGFIKLSTLTTKTFENAATKILEVMGTSLEKDETALTVLGGKIKGAIGTAVEKIGEFTTEKFIPIAKNILSKIGSGMTSAGEAIVDLGGKIKGAIELSIGKIKDFGANYMKPLAGKIMTKIATAVGAETATVGGIANAIGTGITTAFSQVPGLMTGSLSGLASAGAAATAATIATTLVAAVAAVGIGAQVGKAIGDALVSEDMKQYQVDWKYSDFIHFTDDDWSDFWQAFADWWVDVEAWWGDKTLTLRTTVKEAKDGAIASLQEKWNSIQDKTATLIAKAKEGGAEAISKIKQSWNSIKNSTAVKTLKQTGKSAIENIKKTWTSIKDGTVIKTLKQNGGNVLNRIKNTWDSFTSKTIKLDIVTDLVKGAIKTVVEWINKYIIGSLNKLQFKVAGKPIGINIKEIPTPHFAEGGFPQQGQYFLAREKGPELVGTIGRKTAVANNTQIVQSVSDGVYNALNPVLTYLCNAIIAMGEGRQNGQPLYVEGVSEGDIVRVTTKANSDHKKRFGTPLYV